MENLIYNSNDKLHTHNLVKVGDLSFYEGPLLSLFEELNTGHFYLFDWVDRDMKSNRWMIYRVAPRQLLEYINGNISHLELFNNRPNNSTYFTDIDHQNKPFFQYNACALKIIPDNYLPNDENFFDLSNCGSLEKIKSVIITSLSRQKSENEYSKLFKIQIHKPHYDQITCCNRIDRSTWITRKIYSNQSVNVKNQNNLSYLNNNIEYSGIRTLSSKRLKIKKGIEYANQYS
ncbi:hypothetical protein FW774_08530 [Pedobacter sp. BS3]|uniref:DUF6575 domain-containing protein n=1 Tax=Pedobacter sp. BS3 TaxID=2567937 RepID=UPI0011EC02F1|nr:DUF6575 domain-containing protein [Pedobacter sp. BS3]TZF85002.1 hypothetical protein FW774_08530 [Pedobacter sp. BS3]